MILALETATNVCSVAFCNNEGAIFEKSIEKRGSHSEQLFLFIKELQEEHKFDVKDLNAVLVSEGPGSYTGLRISASAVKGLLFQIDVPLIAINTLASFVMQAIAEYGTEKTIHSILDARRVHVYHQQFSFLDGLLTSGDNVEVIPIEAFEAMVQEGDVIVGTGMKRLSDEVLQKALVSGPKYISAQSLIALYQSGATSFCQEVDPESFSPKYYTSGQV